MKLFILCVFLGLTASSHGTIVDVLTEMGQQTILDLLEQTELTEALSGEGPFTAFVPKQEVFESLPQEIIDAITADTEALKRVLLYHVADGSFMSTDLAQDALLPTLADADLRVNIYDVEGETVATVAGIPIDLTMVDIDAGNGVIHFLDFVILSIPSGDTMETLDSLAGSVTFEAIKHAVQELNLGENIASAMDITVLAPIDSDAFNVAVVDELLADPDALTAILSDHVAQGVYFSVGIGLSHEYETIGGNTIVVAFDEETGYAVYDTAGNLLADVIAGDIPTTQGVLHLLDRPIIIA